MSTFLVGAAEVVITPPVGTFLDGYGARTSGSIGVHDDLHARALVLDDGDDAGGDRRRRSHRRRPPTRRAVRDRCASASTGIAAAHILVAATHTHAGPAGLRRRPEWSAHGERWHVSIAGAIVAAHGRKQPAVLKAGRGSVDSVSQNRRDPTGPADDALRVLLFDSPDARRRPIASVVNFACHATVLFHSNMQISADYPGYALRTVKGSSATPRRCSLTAPAATSIRLGSSRTTTRRSASARSSAPRRRDGCRSCGRSASSTRSGTSAGMNSPTTGHVRRASSSPGYAWRRAPSPCSLRQLDTAASRTTRALTELERRASVARRPATSRRRAASWSRLTRLSDASAAVARAPQTGGDRHSLHPEIQAIGLGQGCAVLGLPGEFFVETAQRDPGGGGMPHLLIACYANHYLFYVVPEHEFARAATSRAWPCSTRSAEETMRLAAIALLKEVVD